MQVPSYYNFFLYLLMYLYLYFTCNVTNHGFLQLFSQVPVFRHILVFSRYYKWLHNPSTNLKDCYLQPILNLHCFGILLLSSWVTVTFPLHPALLWLFWFLPNLSFIFYSFCIAIFNKLTMTLKVGLTS